MPPLRYPNTLSEEFRERLPIVRFPSRRQGFRLAFGKARMVEYDLGPGALLHELELRNRIDARSPAARSPRLHDSLVRHKFDVPSRDVAAEERERASHFTTDLRGLASQVHGLQDSTELYDLVELLGVGERIIDALPARFETSFLVNGFRRARNLLLGSSPNLSGDGKTTECDRKPTHQLPPRGPMGQRCQTMSIAHHRPPGSCGHPPD